MADVAVFVVVFIWLVLLTFVVFRTRSHYQRLITTTRKTSIDGILDSLLSRDIELLKETEQLKKQLEEVVSKSMTHIHAVNVVRFNPFEKRGREQSFVVSLLDEHVTGLIMNFMYTPDGLRVFTKKVKEGKGDGYELSEEEKKSLKA